MWDGLLMLLTLSAIMAVASFVAGILPLSLSLSQRQLRFITLLGTGVLVGTSLIVIIPEGIDTMYSAGKASHAHSIDLPAKAAPVLTAPAGVKPPNGFQGIERTDEIDNPFSRRLDKIAPVANIVVKRTADAQEKQLRKAKAEKTKGNLPEKEKDKEEVHGQPQKGDDDSTEGHKEGHTRVHAPQEDKEEAVPEEDHERDPHAYIGVSLILGFILMFLVDHLPEAIAPSKPKYQPLHISLSDLSRGPHSSSSMSLSAMNEPASPMPEHVRAPPPKSSATTIGLIIHAFADGIALGASSTAPSTSLSLIIFVAIMLHKAPAAFGLTSVLLRQGLSKRTARTHLIFFSLAAPAGAIFTWAVVHALGRSTLGGDDGLTWTTGWVLLFSGGTFLYVAMHAMTEATSSHDDPTVANGYTESSHRRGGLSKSDIATTMAGMLIPLITQVGHVH